MPEKRVDRGGAAGVRLTDPEKTVGQDLAPIVIRADAKNLLVVYDGRTWKCSVASILATHGHKNRLRSIVQLRKQKHSFVDRRSTAMTYLGECQKESRPLLLAFPREDHLRLLVGDEVWGCALATALRPPCRRPGGRPLTEKYLEQLAHLVEGGDSDSEVHFADFLKVLDTGLSRLITWTEAKNSCALKNWAGRALAERLRFLSAQEGSWCDCNAQFDATRKQFGDRRHARTPLTYLGWLTEHYVRVIDHDRTTAAFYLDPALTIGETIAELRRYSKDRRKLLRKIAKLPPFSPDSASEWAEIVYARMRMDEMQIMSAPEMSGIRTRDGDRRKDGEARLVDFKPTITKAVITCAKKPRGGVRGVTRP